MTLAGVDCPDCGEEALVIDTLEEIDIGEEAPVVCDECGYETSATRIPIDEINRIDD